MKLDEKFQLEGSPRPSLKLLIWREVDLALSTALIFSLRQLSQLLVSHLYMIDACGLCIYWPSV